MEGNNKHSLELNWHSIIAPWVTTITFVISAAEGADDALEEVVLCVAALGPPVEVAHLAHHRLLREVVLKHFEGEPGRLTPSASGIRYGEIYIYAKKARSLKSSPQSSLLLRVLKRNALSSRIRGKR